MTIEEAIKILDPETRRDALWKYETGEERLKVCNEVCRVACAALRDQPPNDPMTLEELREMDGEPVWVKEIVGGIRDGNWALILTIEREGVRAIAINTSYKECLYGCTWLAYRRKPEEDAHGMD